MERDDQTADLPSLDRDLWMPLNLELRPTSLPILQNWKAANLQITAFGEVFGPDVMGTPVTCGSSDFGAGVLTSPMGPAGSGLSSEG